MSYCGICAVLVILYCTTHVEGSRKMGACDIYSRDEFENLIDMLDCRSCVVAFGEYYCKEWHCPTTPCSNPIYEPGACCSYCKGTCSYRSKVFEVDENKLFRCANGNHMCRCVAEGKVEELRTNEIETFNEMEEFNRALNQCFWKRDEIN